VLGALGRRLFINKGVGLLFAGQVVSQAGDSIFQIALLWMVLDLTGSKSLTGLAAGAAYLPILLFALPAGTLADRFSRKGLMVLADAARLLLVASIPVLWVFGGVTILVLTALTFAIESFSALFFPARDALLPVVCPPARLPHANALIQNSWQLAVLLGPALAALLLPFTGVVHLFTADAATFLVSLLAVAAIAVPARAPAPGPRPSAWADMKEGARYALRNPLMRVVLLVTALDNFTLMGPAIVGVPVFVRDELGLGAVHYAWVEAAYAGGIFVGVPLMSRLGSRAPWGCLLLAGVVLDGLTFIPLLWIRSFWGTVLCIFFHSIFIPLITVSRATLLQERVPDRLRGRMFSLVQMAVIGAAAVSSLWMGLAAERWRTPHIFLGIGILAAATALPGFFSKALADDRHP
jgi:MFS family permease